MLSGIAAARYGQNALSAYGIVMRIEAIMSIHRSGCASEKGLGSMGSPRTGGRSGAGV